MERRSKCRLTVRDEEAGLLFRWRIGRGSVRRTMMAIVLAAVLCVVGALLVRVEGSQEDRGRREAARITVLTPGSEASRRWLAWARQEAPFLDRWEPTGDGTLQVRMERLETILLDRLPDGGIAGGRSGGLRIRRFPKRSPCADDPRSHTRPCHAIGESRGYTTLRHRGRRFSRVRSRHADFATRRFPQPTLHGRDRS